MTRVDHRCGTDRLAEAAEILRLADDDVVVNVQGDEPDMPADCIDRLIELMLQSDTPMATLATPLPADAAGDPNRVKVVLAKTGNALYFSRSKIPFDRDNTGQANHLLHLGIYAYRVGFLKQFTKLAPTPAEESEKLEQLRALEHGFAIRVAVVEYAGGGIDTPEDAVRSAAATRPAGLMIGRAAIGKPWIFREVREVRKESGPSPLTFNFSPLTLFREHVMRIVSHNASLTLKYPELVADPEKPALRAFTSHLFRYFAGMPGANQIRREMNSCRSVGDIFKLAGIATGKEI